MKRREFMNVALGASLMALSPLTGCSMASHVSVKNGQQMPGPESKVFLAGVNKGAKRVAVGDMSGIYWQEVHWA